MPKISVIVPIYNTEQYLEQCLISIIGQSFRDIEIICIDDCSADNSVNIVESFLTKDSRVNLIRHAENRGPGAARNSGIRAAKADYIASVDSDDYIHPDMFARMWQATLDQSMDVVVSGIIRVDEQGHTLSQETHPKRIIYNNEKSIDIFSAVRVEFWGKLWKKSLYTDNNIEFPNLFFGDDGATIPKVIYFAKSIHFIDDNLYYYRKRDCSTIFTFSEKRIADMLHVYDIRYNFLKENHIYNRYNDNLLQRIDNALAWNASMAAVSNSKTKNTLHYLRHLLLIKYGLCAVASDYANFMDSDVCTLLAALRQRSGGQNARIRKKFSYRLFRLLFSPFMSQRHRARLTQDPLSYFSKARHGIPCLFRPLILKQTTCK